MSLGFADGDPREAHRAPGPAVLATALVAAFLAAVRAWMLRWGATTEETHKALPETNWSRPGQPVDFIDKTAP